jgi:hypothetical protein
MTLTGLVVKSAIAEGRWVTVEFIPSNWVGVSQADIELVSAMLASLRWPDYLQMNETHDQLEAHNVVVPCAAGSFSITPRISFGPDHSHDGAPQTITCPGPPEIHVIPSGTTTEIPDGGTFTFPTTTVSSPLIFHFINICNSGPGGLAITNPNTLVSGSGFTQQFASNSGVAGGRCASVRVNFDASAPGEYTGAFTVASNDADENPYEIVLRATVLADQPNATPVVDAGNDQVITLPAQANLDGTVTDDGAPVPPGAVTTQWSKVSGPGTVMFGNTGLVDTTAAFSMAGTYVLRLTASDSLASASDTVTITVNPPTNQPPVVNAGPDQTITLPNTASLNGMVSDDGHPNGTLNTMWSKVSGPGNVSFANANAVNTTASFSAAGSYVLRLSASDGIATVSDDVSITVNSAPAASNVYLSSTGNGSLPGTGSFADEDILLFNGSSNTWSLFFDGSDVGLSASDVDAFALLPNGHLLLSPESAVSLSGAGSVDDSDIVEFTPTSLGTTTAGSYSLFFDGSDVGLSTNNEDVDAIAFTPDGRLVLSTLGNHSVTGVASGADEDLIVLNNGGFGSNTSGNWSLYFDGSDVGLSGSSEDISAAWVASNGDLYLAAGGNFTVNGGVSGQASDVFRCTPTSLGNTSACTFSFFWDGAAHNFSSAVIDGLALDD